MAPVYMSMAVPGSWFTWLKRVRNFQPREEAGPPLNTSTGGYRLALTNPVQRAWRDANVVGRHISLNWDSVGTMVRQNALGLEPKGQY